MYPILYESITLGTVPQDNGLGVLSDCISCEVERERNSIYECIIEYPITGIHAQDFALNRFIKATPNHTDNPQMFFIDRIGAVLRGKFTVYCKHVSYLLSGYLITEGTANNAESACVLLEDATKTNGDENPPDFTIHTDKEVTANFVIREPSSVKSWFVGREGSFLDIFGTADIKYDNFDVYFKLHGGVYEPPFQTIRYAKNLLELSQEIDCSNLYTHVICFYRAEEGPVIKGDSVATGITLIAPRVLVLDVSEEYEEQPTEEDLTARAESYISQNNLTTPTNNITLNFVQSGELASRVDLFDTVNVYYEALGISANFKCIRTKWDCIRERYIETEFGDAKKTLADTISNANSTAEQAMTTAETATAEIGSKKRVFITKPVPPYDVGDLWTDRTNLFVCINARIAGEQFDDDDWSLAADYVGQSAMEEAIADATAIISGSSGGYVVLHDTNSDGKTDELLIMDTPDINTARKVWRWNLGGLAFSPNGYNGPYNSAAITADGQIVATAITTGVLDAQRITVQNLTATMFKGGHLILGGKDNGDGVFELKNASGVTIGEMDNTGLTFYGAGAVGARPYVKLDMNGLTGYDASGAWIFKVERDEFVMKKCVAQQEINACGRIKFVPVTTASNNGVAIVAL